MAAICLSSSTCMMKSRSAVLWLNTHPTCECVQGAARRVQAK